MVNTIWISFLSAIAVFFTLYSIFSKKEESNEDDGNIYDNFKSKSRSISRIRSRRPPKKVEVKVKEKTKNVKPKSKPKSKPKPKKKEIKKVSKPKVTKPKVKEVPHKVSKSKPKISEKVSKSKPKPKPSPKPKPVKEVKPKSKPKPKTKPKVKNDKKGLEFKGQFDDKEVEFLKKYAIKNRGFVTQKLNGKVATKRWLKTKRSYDMLMDEISNKKDKNGSYKTYVIWDNKVDKYLLKSKIK